MADDFTIGVEEEYQLLDRGSYALVPGVDRVLPTAERALGDVVQPELHQAQIEIGTPVCTSLDDVRAELARLRQGVAAAAAASGHLIAAAGTHPFSRWEGQRITGKAAYEGLAERYAHLADEQLIWGCHVHVCITDAETAIQVMNHARPWLPVLLALSASSPFWEGVDTGYASYRTEVFGRWPTAGAPQVFASRRDYDALVDDLVATGSIDQPARIYWHVRPSAKFETLEFRVADVCTRVDDAVLVAGLVRAVARRCHDDVTSGRAVPEVRPELLRAAIWRAARNGTSAELVDLQRTEEKPAADVVRRLLAFVRPTTPADEWNVLVDLAGAVLDRGTSAERQRAVYAKTQSLPAVAAWLAEETLHDL